MCSFWSGKEEDGTSMGQMVQSWILSVPNAHLKASQGFWKCCTSWKNSLPQTSLIFYIYRPKLLSFFLKAVYRNRMFWHNSLNRSCMLYISLERFTRKMPFFLWNPLFFFRTVKETNYENQRFFTQYAVHIFMENNAMFFLWIFENFEK